MVHITLFIPNSVVPLEYDAKSYNISENGVLHFRLDDKSLGAASDVSTTVPFLVRNPVKEKAVVQQERQGPPPRVGKWS